MWPTLFGSGWIWDALVAGSLACFAVGMLGFLLLVMMKPPRQGSDEFDEVWGVGRRQLRRTGQRRKGEAAMMMASLAKAIQRVLVLSVIAGAAAMIPGTAGLAAAAHTVDVSIVAGKDGGSGGFDFNGYRNGAMTITVPVGWQVVVHFTNANELPHSVAVLPVGAEKQPMPGGNPVFSGATTKDLAAGLPKGGKQTFTFEASKPGTYEFVCGVSGHAIAGMWDKLVVSPTAQAPGVTPAGAATLTVGSN